MSPENTENTNQETPSDTPEQLEIAVLPLQNTTLFPETVVPLSVGRSRSISAVEAALATQEKLIACITTKSAEIAGQDAKSADLYDVGTIVNIKRMMRNDDVLQLIVQGIDRVRVLEWTQEQPFLRANGIRPQASGKNPLAG